MTIQTKGPAEAATSPSHGSNDHGDQQMNATTNSTLNTENPVKRTDRQIANDFYDLDCDVTDLRRAAMVLEEYLTFEFGAARDPRKEAAFPYTLTQCQADGIAYMADHVRGLAFDLERKFGAVIGREEGQ